MLVHPDRLFPVEPSVRDIARRLYARVEKLPIVSPHGHTDPRWFAENAPFLDPVSLLVEPDHYLLRMFYSQGIPLEALGVGENVRVDPREAWRVFAEHFRLFRATPSAQWLNHTFVTVFGLDEPLGVESADRYFDRITDALKAPEFRPRALFERFNIEVLCTTDSPVDSLEHHRTIRESAWSGRVIPCFRPDPVLDPEHGGFGAGIETLAALTGEDAHTYSGYLAALRERRAFFKSLGATATDHGHPSPLTLDLARPEVEALFARAIAGSLDSQGAERFRAHMLVEMARMSIDDGMVMQLHPGSYRNHNPSLFSKLGPDKGADIPVGVEFTRALKPLLDAVGDSRDLTLIVFTLDETTYSRELAPLAGHYPALRLGPAWWFHDSPEGMIRFREQTTETAGFYNTVGFNDDTRAFFSIPARHDVARRIDCRVLSQWVAEHRLSEDEAAEVVVDLAYRLPKDAYSLDAV
ncbi:MAG: glucuronate isomerase [Myxococcota bacterium]